MHLLIRPNRHGDMQEKKSSTGYKQKYVDPALLGSKSSVGRKRTNVAWNENLHRMNRTKCNNKKKTQENKMYFSVNNA